MTTRKHNAEATQNALDSVAQIAAAQRQIAQILDAAARQVQELEVAAAQHAVALEWAITRKNVDPAAVARALAAQQVSTGNLPCRTVDALEARGQRVFPTAYTPIESKWALVHGSH